MNTKALRRQLLAAIAMLLVATVALGSSTYAWFAQNTKVHAEMMSVTAKSSDPFLQIKKTGGEFTTSVDNMEITQDEMKLVNPGSDLPTVAWYETISDDPAVAVTDASAVTDNIKAVEDGDTKYMIKTVLTLKNASTSTDATNLTASADIDAGSADLNPSVRVLLIAGEAFVLFNDEGIVVGGDAVLAEELAADSTLDVTVYVYFDGTDDAATTNNAHNLDAVTVALDFEVDSIQ